MAKTTAEKQKIIPSKNVLEIDVEKLSRLYDEAFDNTIAAFKKKWEQIYQKEFDPYSIGRGTIHAGNLDVSHEKLIEVTFEEYLSSVKKSRQYFSENDILDTFKLKEPIRKKLKRSPATIIQAFKEFRHCLGDLDLDQDVLFARETGIFPQRCTGGLGTGYERYLSEEENQRLNAYRKANYEEQTRIRRNDTKFSKLILGLEELSVYMTRTPAEDALSALCDRSFALQLRKKVIPYLQEFYVECRTEIVPHQGESGKLNFLLKDIPAFGCHIIMLALQNRCVEDCLPDSRGRIVYFDPSGRGGAGFEKDNDGMIYFRGGHYEMEWESRYCDLTAEQVDFAQGKLKQYNDRIWIKD